MGNRRAGGIILRFLVFFLFLGGSSAPDFTASIASPRNDHTARHADPQRRSCDGHVSSTHRARPCDARPHSSLSQPPALSTLAERLALPLLLSGSLLSRW